MIKKTWKLVRTTTNSVCIETEFTFSTKEELLTIHKEVSRYFGERKFHVERITQSKV